LKSDHHASSYGQLCWGSFFKFFLYISTFILLVFLSLCSAEADIGPGEKLNGHLMAKLCQEYSHQKL